jgi:hypothetical protein
MAGLIKNLRVTKTGSSSRTLEEAHRRSMDFFREACRALPDIMDRYNLQEVTTLSELRSKIAAEFRKHSKVTNLKVYMPYHACCSDSSGSRDFAEFLALFMICCIVQALFDEVAFFLWPSFAH